MKKGTIPNTILYRGKRYKYHNKYPTQHEADSHATYLRAGALFQGKFKTVIKGMVDGRGKKWFVLYKYRIAWE